MSGTVIPHTPIAVDLWRVRECAHARLFFLTHLHADHTVGLTPSWCRPLYCTPLTKRLLVHRQQVREELIIALEVGCSHIVWLDSEKSESMTVTVLDAHHCPGAVMYLFQGYFGTVLHTGDFRYTEEMFIDTPLTTLGSIDVLYLDNTYASPDCEFPTRKEAVKEIKDILDRHPDHEVLIGMRTLGKEDLLVTMALHARSRVVVTDSYLEHLAVLELLDVFTTDEQAGRLHAIPFQQLTLSRLRRWNNRRPTIGILPTAMRKAATRSKEDGDQMLFVVPYSDHSNYTELQQFVAQLRPSRIVPIVAKKEDKSTDVRASVSCFQKYLRAEESTTPIKIPATVAAFMKSKSQAASRSRKRKRGVASAPVSRKKQAVVKGIIYEESSDKEQCGSQTLSGEEPSDDVSCREEEQTEKTSLKGDSQQEIKVSSSKEDKSSSIVPTSAVGRSSLVHSSSAVQSPSPLLSLTEPTSSLALSSPTVHSSSAVYSPSHVHSSPAVHSSTVHPSQTVQSSPTVHSTTVHSPAAVHSPTVHPPSTVQSTSVYSSSTLHSSTTVYTSSTIHLFPTVYSSSVVHSSTSSAANDSNSAAKTHTERCVQSRGSPVSAEAATNTSVPFQDSVQQNFTQQTETGCQLVQMKKPNRIKKVRRKRRRMKWHLRPLDVPKQRSVWASIVDFHEHFQNRQSVMHEGQQQLHAGDVHVQSEKSSDDGSQRRSVSHESGPSELSANSEKVVISNNVSCKSSSTPDTFVELNAPNKHSSLHSVSISENHTSVPSKECSVGANKPAGQASGTQAVTDTSVRQEAVHRCKSSQHAGRSCTKCIMDRERVAGVGDVCMMYSPISDHSTDTETGRVNAGNDTDQITYGQHSTARHDPVSMKQITSNPKTSALPAPDKPARTEDKGLQTLHSEVDSYHRQWSDPFSVFDQLDEQSTTIDEASDNACATLIEQEVLRFLQAEQVDTAIAALPAAPDSSVSFEAADPYGRVPSVNEGCDMTVSNMNPLAEEDLRDVTEGASYGKSSDHALLTIDTDLVHSLLSDDPLSNTSHGRCAMAASTCPAGIISTGERRRPSASHTVPSTAQGRPNPELEDISQTLSTCSGDLLRKIDCLLEKLDPPLSENSTLLTPPCSDGRQEYTREQHSLTTSMSIPTGHHTAQCQNTTTSDYHPSRPSLYEGPELLTANLNSPKQHPETRPDTVCCSSSEYVISQDKENLASLAKDNGKSKHLIWGPTTGASSWRRRGRRQSYDPERILPDEDIALPGGLALAGTAMKKKQRNVPSKISGEKSTKKKKRGWPKGRPRLPRNKLPFSDSNKPDKPVKLIIKLKRLSPFDLRIFQGKSAGSPKKDCNTREDEETERCASENAHLTPAISTDVPSEPQPCTSSDYTSPVTMIHPQTQPPLASNFDTSVSGFIPGLAPCEESSTEDLVTSSAVDPGSSGDVTVRSGAQLHTPSRLPELDPHSLSVADQHFTAGSGKTASPLLSHPFPQGVEDAVQEPDTAFTWDEAEEMNSLWKNDIHQVNFGSEGLTTGSELHATRYSDYSEEEEDPLIITRGRFRWEQPPNNVNFLDSTNNAMEEESGQNDENTEASGAGSYGNTVETETSSTTNGSQDSTGIPDIAVSTFQQCNNHLGDAGDQDQSYLDHTSLENESLSAANQPCLPQGDSTSDISVPIQHSVATGGVQDNHEPHEVRYVDNWSSGKDTEAFDSDEINRIRIQGDPENLSEPNVASEGPNNMDGFAAVGTGDVDRSTRALYEGGGKVPHCMDSEGLSTNNRDCGEFPTDSQHCMKECTTDALSPTDETSTKDVPDCVDTEGLSTNNTDSAEFLTAAKHCAKECTTDALSANNEAAIEKGSEEEADYSEKNDVNYRKCEEVTNSVDGEGFSANNADCTALPTDAQYCAKECTTDALSSTDETSTGKGSKEEVKSPEENNVNSPQFLSDDQRYTKESTTDALSATDETAIQKSSEEEADYSEKTKVNSLQCEEVSDCMDSECLSTHDADCGEVLSDDQHCMKESTTDAFSTIDKTAMEKISEEEADCPKKNIVNSPQCEEVPDCMDSEGLNTNNTNSSEFLTDVEHCSKECTTDALSSTNETSNEKGSEEEADCAEKNNMNSCQCEEASDCMGNEGLSANNAVCTEFLTDAQPCTKECTTNALSSTGETSTEKGSEEEVKHSEENNVNSPQYEKVSYCVDGEGLSANNADCTALLTDAQCCAKDCTTDVLSSTDDTATEKGNEDEVKCPEEINITSPQREEVSDCMNSECLSTHNVDCAAFLSDDQHCMKESSTDAFSVTDKTAMEKSSEEEADCPEKNNMNSLQYKEVPDCMDVEGLNSNANSSAFLIDVEHYTKEFTMDALSSINETSNEKGSEEKDGCAEKNNMNSLQSEEVLDCMDVEGLRAYNADCTEFLTDGQQCTKECTTDALSSTDETSAEKGSEEAVKCPEENNVNSPQCEIVSDCVDGEALSANNVACTTLLTDAQYCAKNCPTDALSSTDDTVTEKGNEDDVKCPEENNVNSPQCEKVSDSKDGEGLSTKNADSTDFLTDAQQCTKECTTDALSTADDTPAENGREEKVKCGDTHDIYSSHSGVEEGNTLMVLATNDKHLSKSSMEGMENIQTANHSDEDDDVSSDIQWSVTAQHSDKAVEKVSSGIQDHYDIEMQEESVWGEPNENPANATIDAGLEESEEVHQPTMGDVDNPCTERKSTMETDSETSGSSVNGQPVTENSPTEVSESSQAVLQFNHGPDTPEATGPNSEIKNEKAQSRTEDVEHPLEYVAESCVSLLETSVEQNVKENELSCHYHENPNDGAPEFPEIMEDTSIAAHENLSQDGDGDDFSRIETNGEQNIEDDELSCHSHVKVNDVAPQYAEIMTGTSNAGHENLSQDGDGGDSPRIETNVEQNVEEKELSCHSHVKVNDVTPQYAEIMKDVSHASHENLSQDGDGGDSSSFERNEQNIEEDELSCHSHLKLNNVAPEFPEIMEDASDAGHENLSQDCDEAGSSRIETNEEQNIEEDEFSCHSIVKVNDVAPEFPEIMEDARDAGHENLSQDGDEAGSSRIETNEEQNIEEDELSCHSHIKVNDVAPEYADIMKDTSIAGHENLSQDGDGGDFSKIETNVEQNGEEDELSCHSHVRVNDVAPEFHEIMEDASNAGHENLSQDGDGDDFSRIETNGEQNIEDDELFCHSHVKVNDVALEFPEIMEDASDAGHENLSQDGDGGDSSRFERNEQNTEEDELSCHSHVKVNDVAPEFPEVMEDARDAGHENLSQDCDRGDIPGIDTNVEQNIEEDELSCHSHVKVNDVAPEFPEIMEDAKDAGHENLSQDGDRGDIPRIDTNVEQNLEEDELSCHSHVTVNDVAPEYTEIMTDTSSGGRENLSQDGAEGDVPRMETNEEQNVEENELSCHSPVKVNDVAPEYAEIMTNTSSAGHEKLSQDGDEGDSPRMEISKEQNTEEDEHSCNSHVKVNDVAPEFSEITEDARNAGHKNLSQDGDGGDSLRMEMNEQNVEEDELSCHSHMKQSVAAPEYPVIMDDEDDPDLEKLSQHSDGEESCVSMLESNVVQSGEKDVPLCHSHMKRGYFAAPGYPVVMGDAGDPGLDNLSQYGDGEESGVSISEMNVQLNAGKDEFLGHSPVNPTNPTTLECLEHMEDASDAGLENLSQDGDRDESSVMETNVEQNVEENDLSCHFHEKLNEVASSGCLEHMEGASDPSLENLSQDGDGGESRVLTLERNVPQNVEEEDLACHSHVKLCGLDTPQCLELVKDEGDPDLKSLLQDEHGGECGKLTVERNIEESELSFHGQVKMSGVATVECLEQVNDADDSGLKNLAHDDGDESCVTSDTNVPQNVEEAEYPYCSEVKSSDVAAAESLGNVEDPGDPGLSSLLQDGDGERLCVPKLEQNVQQNVEEEELLCHSPMKLSSVATSEYPEQVKDLDDPGPKKLVHDGDGDECRLSTLEANMQQNVDMDDCTYHPKLKFSGVATVECLGNVEDAGDPGLNDLLQDGDGIESYASTLKMIAEQNIKEEGLSYHSHEKLCGITAPQCLELIKNESDTSQISHSFASPCITTHSSNNNCLQHTLTPSANSNLDQNVERKCNRVSEDEVSTMVSRGHSDDIQYEVDTIVSRGLSGNILYEVGTIVSRGHSGDIQYEVGTIVSRGHSDDIQDKIDTSISRGHSDDIHDEVGTIISRGPSSDVQDEGGMIVSRGHSGDVQDEVGTIVSRGHSGDVPDEVGTIVSRRHSDDIQYEVGTFVSRGQSGDVQNVLGTIVSRGHSGDVEDEVGTIVSGHHTDDTQDEVGTVFARERDPSGDVQDEGGMIVSRGHSGDVQDVLGTIVLRCHSDDIQYEVGTIVSSGYSGDTQGKVDMNVSRGHSNDVQSQENEAAGISSSDRNRTENAKQSRAEPGKDSSTSSKQSDPMDVISAEDLTESPIGVGRVASPIPSISEPASPSNVDSSVKDATFIKKMSLPGRMADITKEGNLSSEDERSKEERLLESVNCSNDVAERDSKDSFIHLSGESEDIPSDGGSVSLINDEGAPGINCYSDMIEEYSIVRTESSKEIPVEIASSSPGNDTIRAASSHVTDPGKSGHRPDPQWQHTSKLATFSDSGNTPEDEIILSVGCESHEDTHTHRRNSISEIATRDSFGKKSHRAGSDSSVFTIVDSSEDDELPQSAQQPSAHHQAVEGNKTQSDEHLGAAHKPVGKSNRQIAETVGSSKQKIHHPCLKGAKPRATPNRTDRDKTKQMTIVAYMKLNVNSQQGNTSGEGGGPRERRRRQTARKRTSLVSRATSAKKICNNEESTMSERGIMSCSRELSPPGSSYSEPSRAVPRLHLQSGHHSPGYCSNSGRQPPIDSSLGTRDTDLTEYELEHILQRTHLMRQESVERRRRYSSGQGRDTGSESSRDGQTRKTFSSAVPQHSEVSYTFTRRVNVDVGRDIPMFDNHVPSRRLAVVENEQPSHTVGVSRMQREGEGSWPFPRMSSESTIRHSTPASQEKYGRQHLKTDSIKERNYPRQVSNENELFTVQRHSTRSNSSCPGSAIQPWSGMPSSGRGPDASSWMASDRQLEEVFPRITSRSGYACQERKAINVILTDGEVFDVPGTTTNEVITNEVITLDD